MAEKENKYKFLAADARKIADSTDCILSRIYKVIRESAEEGETQLDWSFGHPSKVAIENAKKDLEKAGYKVIIINSDICLDEPVGLNIRW